MSARAIPTHLSIAAALQLGTQLDALTWLADPFRLLAYQDEQPQHDQVMLGLKAARAVVAACICQRLWAAHPSGIF